MGSVREDLEDDFLTINHREPGELLPVALLRWREGLVEHDHVRPIRLGLLGQFLRLARAEQKRRRRLAQVHQGLTGDGQAQVLDQFGQFAQQFRALSRSHVRGLHAHEERAFKFVGCRSVEEVGHQVEG